MGLDEYQRETSILFALINLVKLIMNLSLNYFTNSYKIITIRNQKMANYIDKWE